MHHYYLGKILYRTLDYKMGCLTKRQLNRHLMRHRRIMRKMHVRFAVARAQHLQKLVADRATAEEARLIVLTDAVRAAVIEANTA